MGASVRIYPHNDLINLASYHLETINRKISGDDHYAIYLDCTSCTLALALSVEAIINFVGSKRIPEWDEWMSYDRKIKAIERALGVSIKQNSEFQISVYRLKKIRDELAHPKPRRFNAQAESWNELNEIRMHAWDPSINPDFCNLAYKQVRAFKEFLFSSAKITIGESLTTLVGGWSTLRKLK